MLSPRRARKQAARQRPLRTTTTRTARDVAAGRGARQSAAGDAPGRADRQVQRATKARKKTESCRGDRAHGGGHAHVGGFICLSTLGCSKSEGAAEASAADAAHDGAGAAPDRGRGEEARHCNFSRVAAAGRAPRGCGEAARHCEVAARRVAGLPWAVAGPRRDQPPKAPVDAHRPARATAADGRTPGQQDVPREACQATPLRPEGPCGDCRGTI